MALRAQVLVFALVLSCTCYGQEAVVPGTANAICGTWIRTQTLADGSELSLMKIITPTHFAVFQQTAGNAHRELFQAHSGRYVLRDGVMLEAYEFSSDPQAIGQRGRCRVAVGGDELRQTWMSDDGREAVEVWKRKPPTERP